jgi:hypothetical protein
LHPNNTFEKVRFNAWQQTTWDTNDTVLMIPKEDEDIGGYVTEYFKEETDYKTWYEQRIPDRTNIPPISARTPEQQVTVQTQKHADTPTVLYLDNYQDHLKQFKTMAPMVPLKPGSFLTLKATNWK